MKLNATIRDYGTHLAIRLITNGKQVGWIQFEGDNFAYYGSLNCKTAVHRSGIYIKNIIPTV